MDLQKIFSISDQCLELKGPLQPILDRIHAVSTIDNPDDAYLLRRLPIKAGGVGQKDAFIVFRSTGGGGTVFFKLISILALLSN